MARFRVRETGAVATAEGCGCWGKTSWDWAHVDEYDALSVTLSPAAKIDRKTPARMNARAFAKERD
jgi:hypothetical protein